MEAKTSFITKFTTFWVVILTITIASILMTESVSRQNTIWVGVISLMCLFFFAGVLTRLGAAERKKRVYYEIS
ncbi:MAG: hypothetical protein V4619_02425 [Bacteroidota bacterium]